MIWNFMSESNGDGWSFKQGELVYEQAYLRWKSEKRAILIELHDEANLESEREWECRML